MARKKKQAYKPLTQWQEKKATARAVKGWSQERIAKSLGVAKLRVNRYLQAKTIGKRRAAGTSMFWNDVRSTQRQNEVSWKKAIQQTKGTKFWGERKAARLNKKYKQIADFWKEAQEEGLTQEEIAQKWEDESEEFYFGTPT